MRSGSYIKAMAEEDSGDSDGSPKPSPKVQARRASYLKATQPSLTEMTTLKWVCVQYSLRWYLKLGSRMIQTLIKLLPSCRQEDESGKYRQRSGVLFRQQRSSLYPWISGGHGFKTFVSAVLLVCGHTPNGPSCNEKVNVLRKRSAASEHASRAPRFKFFVETAFSCVNGFPFSRILFTPGAPSKFSNVGRHRDLEKHWPHLTCDLITRSSSVMLMDTSKGYLQQI